ncbi:MAG: RDD family protein [Planctomycetes bacterium]|nr:RDD family protein [Planctomycetota bacterium]MCH9727185.1 RDD family protein [Planctomycetota bacterium]MCH9778578.1 RDD family protein [Planctomycetota bacterium]MCH9793252.1 RDD family protein [Planctomycetota bacterium]
MISTTIGETNTTPAVISPPENSNRREVLGLEMLIETPENVILTYQLAGPAKRYLAYIIDLAIRVALTLGMMIVVPMLGFVLPGTAMGVLLVLMFLNTWGYYTISEGFFKGQSIGKHICGIRVIRDGGYPITFWPALLRNLVRNADAIIFYGVGITSMLLTRRFQRLGDLVAGTVVIQERTLSLPRKPVILDKIQPLNKNEIGSFLPRDEVLSLIDEFIGRRHVLTYDRGHALAAVLANNLAERLNYSGDPKKLTQYPMAFLAAVYKTFSFSQQEEEQEFVSAYHLRNQTAEVNLE